MVVELPPKIFHKFDVNLHEIFTVHGITPESIVSSAESFKKDRCQYVNEVLVNRSFKLAQENVWLGELTVPP